MVLLALAACDKPAPNPFVTTTPASVVREPALVFDGEPPHRVLMLSIDTFRRDAFFPFTADGRDDTPFLSKLAAQGLLATDHRQCSDWTFASTSCTLDGRYSEETGFVPTLHAPITDPANQLPAGRRTLAVRLADAGWHTILVSSNGWLTPDDGNAQGYAEFSKPDDASAHSIVADGLQRLQASGATDWLLHLHFIEPHPAYNPPADYLAEEAALPPLDPSIDLTDQDGQYDATDQWPTLDPEQQANLAAHLRARYHGELRWLDDQLADAWSDLDDAGLLDGTLVVVWSDHGEQFWERGDQSHGFSLGAEENDAVLFFWARDLRPGRWTEPSHAVDLVPTVLHAVGLPASDPVLSGDVLGLGKVHRPLFASTNGRNGVQAAVTLDGWKLIFDFDGRTWLYDRSADRTEAADRLPAHPEDPHLAPLWDLLLPHVEALHDAFPDAELTWPEHLPHGPW